jgi:hypothetical protein
MKQLNLEDTEKENKMEKRIYNEEAKSILVRMYRDRQNSVERIAQTLSSNGWITSTGAPIYPSFISLAAREAGLPARQKRASFGPKTKVEPTMKESAAPPPPSSGLVEEIRQILDADLRPETLKKVLRALVVE